MTVDTRIFDFKMPALTMGVGARKNLPKLVDSLGRRALVVTDAAMAKQPAFQECVRDLTSAGIEAHVFSEITSDPPISDVTACAGAAGESGVDAVVGIGGGSSLDVAKCAAIVLRHDCDINDIFGVDNTPGRGLPTILLPTTAGTGSEVTPIAILSDHQMNLKRGIVSDDLLADIALVDPELCVSLPPRPTAYTGMDALTHAIEAYTNKFAVPLIDSLALEAVRLIFGNLRECVENGGDIEARYAMSRASLLGGFCLYSVSTAAVHALAYPLGGEFNVPHGIANSLLLPHVMRFNEPVAAGRHARMAETIGAQDAIKAIEELSRAVGTSRRMREFGVKKDDLKRMASSALQVQRLLSNNPREVTEEDALAIYTQAF